MDKKKLIVVDDDESIREFLEILFQKKGFEVKTASGGKEFFGIIDNFIPQAIILDEMMPDMTGESICEKIRQERIYDNVKVFFLSVVIPTNDKLRLLKEKYKVSEYFNKPFVAEELADKVFSLS